MLGSNNQPQWPSSRMTEPISRYCLSRVLVASVKMLEASVYLFCMFRGFTHIMWASFMLRLMASKERFACVAGAMCVGCNLCRDNTQRSHNCWPKYLRFQAIKPKIRYTASYAYNLLTDIIEYQLNWTSAHRSSPATVHHLQNFKPSRAENQCLGSRQM